MIGHKRIPGREGGVEVAVENLAINLVQLGHSVTVYNRFKKGVKTQKEYKGISIKTVFTVNHKNLDALIYSFLSSISVCFGEYDIIHYHAIGPSFFLFIPKFLKKRIIVTVHGLNYKTPKWKGFGEIFLRAGEVITAKLADEIIVLSHDQQAYFYNKYNRNCMYIPNGCEINDLKPANLIRDFYGIDRNYLLFVSRVVPGKGLEYLIEAYKQIKTTFPLLIAGDSEYVPEFRNKIEKSINGDERIKLLGFVEGEILQELFSNCSVFIFPSEAEGMPISLLEALSYNCCCLVSDIKENLEIGREFIHTFKSKDSFDLKLKLENIISKREFTNNSRDYILKNYSWIKNAKETVDCYEKR